MTTHDPKEEGLPEEILISIFSWLNVSDLCRAGAVCKLWRRVSQDDHLWRQVYFKVNLFDPPLNFTYPSGTGEKSWEVAPTKCWQAALQNRWLDQRQAQILLHSRNVQILCLERQLKQVQQECKGLISHSESLAFESAAQREMTYKTEMELRDTRAEFEDANYELMLRAKQVQQTEKEVQDLQLEVQSLRCAQTVQEGRFKLLMEENKILKARAEKAEAVLSFWEQRFWQERKRNKELRELLDKEHLEKVALLQEQSKIKVSTKLARKCNF
jgi:hypothetical protein